MGFKKETLMATGYAFLAAALFLTGFLFGYVKAGTGVYEGLGAEEYNLFHCLKAAGQTFWEPNRKAGCVTAYELDIENKGLIWTIEDLEKSMENKTLQEG
tara:strand:+ start:8170 stop:8469 length:300 start_codon:yes stop_codon:yes gene_type:complete